jgi:LacI family transcriptional regulator
MELAPVVFLFAPLGFSYAREIIRGVREYTQKNVLWQLALFEPSIRNLKSLKREDAHGIIGLFHTEEMEQLARSLKVPAINVSSRCKGNVLPGVVPENTAIARLAAEHCMQRGFRHFACAVYRQHYFSQARFQAFQTFLQEKGLKCNYLPDGQDVRAIRSVEKPVAIFACNDQRARQVLGACIRGSVKVPQEAAIIGVDNDELLCELAEVPLSSVDPNGRRIGFEAAAALDRLMKHEPLEQKLTFIQPAGLIIRSSSDVIAVSDEQVAMAMRYMQTHACDPMHVRDMLGAMEVSRRTLEKRFRSIVGHTLHDEIRRIQFERAKKLLAETDLKIPDVATRCGFKDPKRFTTLFRAEFGTPPIAFRRVRGQMELRIAK